MESLEPAKNDLGFIDHTLMMDKRDTIPPHPFLRCPKLVKLDFQWLHNRHFSVIWRPSMRSRSSMGMSTQLPQGLTELHLPKSWLPQALHEMVEALPLLISLDCSMTEYYPSCKLSKLEVRLFSSVM
jgi:hypothetical protein